MKFHIEVGRDEFGEGYDVLFCADQNDFILATRKAKKAAIKAAEKFAEQLGGLKVTVEEDEPDDE